MRRQKKTDAEIVAGKQIVPTSDLENDLRSFYNLIISSDRSKKEKKRMCYILRALPQGHESSVQTPDLMEATGYSISVLKNTIRNMRVIGVPVASWQKGYYLCVDDDERQMFYEYLMKKIRTAVEESECFCVRRKRVK